MLHLSPDDQGGQQPKPPNWTEDTPHNPDEDKQQDQGDEDQK